MKNNSRGVAIIDDIFYIAIAAAVLFGAVQVKKIVAPSKPVAAITKTDDAVAVAQKDAADAKAAAAQLQAKLDAATKATADKEASAAGFIAGASLELNNEPNPSIDVRIAKVMVEDAGKTLDPVTAEKLAEMTKLVLELRAANVTTSAALTEKETEATQARAASTAKDAELQESAATVATLTTLTQTQATAAKELSAKNVAWAKDSENAWDRAKAALWLVALLVVVAVIIAIKLLGVTKVKNEITSHFKDSVALGEHTLATIEKVASPAVRATVEEAQKVWKEGDTKFDAAVATAKADMRL